MYTVTHSQYSGCRYTLICESIGVWDWLSAAAQFSYLFFTIFTFKNILRNIKK